MTLRLTKDKRFLQTAMFNADGIKLPKEDVYKLLARCYILNEDHYGKYLMVHTLGDSIFKYDFDYDFKRLCQIVPVKYVKHTNQKIYYKGKDYDCTTYVFNVTKEKLFQLCRLYNVL